jgi:hypothetical protein
MSSFILDKKEFIKAAGIMCGIDGWWGEVEL